MNIFETLRDQEQNYVNGTVQLGKYVSWSMYDTIETINAYLNSVHISGETDSLGREKPFFNIVTAAANIWYRATDLDRKDVIIQAPSASQTALAFGATVLIQDWMIKEKFGHFLNEWGRTLAKYGSAVVKFVQKDGRLIPSVISWNNLIVDAINFEANPVIEKYYLTPAELRKNKNYDQEKVEELIKSAGGRENLDDSQVDNKGGYIEIYEIHGEFERSFITGNEKDTDYSQQVHIVSYVAKDDGYDDYSLFSKEEKRSPYMITHLIKEADRTLSIGAVEYLFDAQWMVNHTVKQTKDYLDLASKLIFQTSDGNFIGRNVLTNIETGEILRHALNQPLTQVNNSAQNITAIQSFGVQWQTLAKEVTSSPDAFRGNTLPSGTPYSLGAILQQQAGSLFEVMTENKGLHLEDMLREFVIPYVKTKMDTTEEIGAILDERGIAEIDAMYVPREAVRRHNDMAIKDLIADKEVTPFNPIDMEAQVRKDLSAFGNMRYIKPSDIPQKTWKEALKDLEWKVRVQVTNETIDKQAALTTLSTVLQTISSNPTILQDPNAKMVFSKILQQLSIISPMEFTTATAPNPSQPPTQGSGEVANLASNITQ